MTCRNRLCVQAFSAMAGATLRETRHGTEIFQSREQEGRGRNARDERGKLKSGRSGAKVKSRKQAIAIGLSEARRAGKKVPAKRSSRKTK
jgi:hypothetical protein